ncbi:MAG: tRNA uridine-5-carboxymethylaminomethyl(34) synthesis enzyme MnmG, partial [Bacteroidia bacterium]|nr:tRNA uridine-5-carboxymethylaminomethyl(34) synthesis enzyme MnmG [Bacteroidia bacterium]
DEPYRMFTSRAEYRIMLRQDNADIRLTEKGYQLGLAKAESLQRVEKKIKDTDEIIGYFKKTSVTPTEINPMLEGLGTTTIPQNYKLDAILSRPQVELKNITDALPELNTYLNKFNDDALLQAEVLLKYEGYLEKEKQVVEKMNRLEDVNIRDDFDYLSVQSISKEAREKLHKQRPKTLGQASRISGISPADVSVLMVHIGR